MKQTLIIHILDGQIVNKKPVRLMFESLPNGKYKIEVSSAKQRSSNQNRYYWGLCLPMVRAGIKEMGTELSLEETHEFLKKEFNYKELVNEGTGEIKQIPLSTTRLTTVGMMEYIEKVQRFAAEFLNVVIPNPNEQIQIDYVVAEYDTDNNLILIQ